MYVRMYPIFRNGNKEALLGVLELGKFRKSSKIQDILGAS